MSSILLDRSEPIGPTNIINKNKSGAKRRRNERILVRRSDFLRLSLRGTPSFVSNCPLASKLRVSLIDNYKYLS